MVDLFVLFILFDNYFQFEQILIIDKKQFFIERLLIKGDCEFFFKVGIIVRLKQFMLRVVFVKKDLV